MCWLEFDCICTCMHKGGWKSLWTVWRYRVEARGGWCTLSEPSDMKCSCSRVLKMDISDMVLGGPPLDAWSVLDSAWHLNTRSDCHQASWMICSIYVGISGLIYSSMHADVHFQHLNMYVSVLCSVPGHAEFAIYLVFNGICVVVIFILSLRTVRLRLILRKGCV